MLSWWKSLSSVPTEQQQQQEGKEENTTTSASVPSTPATNKRHLEVELDKWSYIELSTPTSDSDFEKLQQSTLERILEFYSQSGSQNGWEQVTVDQGISLSQRTVGNSPYKMIKCSGLIEGVRPEEMFFMFNDVSLEEKKFTPELKEQILVKNVSESCKVIRSLFDSGTPGVSDRCFVSIRCTHTMQDGTLVVYGVSVNCIDEPFTKNCVRATQLAGVFCQPVVGHPNSVFLTTIDLVDPKGWIPSFVVNFFNLKAIDRLKMIRQLFADRVKSNQTTSNAELETPPKSDEPLSDDEAFERSEILNQESIDSQ